MIMKIDNEYIQCSRLRSARRRKRIEREDFNKQLIRLHKEERRIRDQIWDLGYEELIPPVQRGWKRSFVLRSDFAKRKDAKFFKGILDKINTTEYSWRKDFKIKRRKYGKKVYVVDPQYLQSLWPHDYEKKIFTDKEKRYFTLVPVYMRHSKKMELIYVFNMPWCFVLKVQPNIITKAKIKDFELERRKEEIDRFLSFNSRREKLLKLLHGNGGWKWCNKEREKYKSPFLSKSFANILNEFYERPQLKVSYKNPRQSRGFSFMSQIVLEVLTALEFFLSFHVSIEVLTSRLDYEARHKGFGRRCCIWL
jgi:hypothetical protein